MEKSGGKADKGFTIIEVALVLAIAGLIFVMVFLALPALQRSERDSERRENVMLLLKKIRDYQTANRGALPAGAEVGATEPTEVVTYSESMNSSISTDWINFYKDFLGENFQDPTGDHYDLKITVCGKSVTVGNPCNGFQSTNIIAQGGKIKDVGSTALATNKMWIVRQATCEYVDDIGYTLPVKSSNPRKVAVVYNLETSGVYCQNS